MPANTDAVCPARQRFISFAREMPATADAVCFARQRFISFAREMPAIADAVCFARQRFISCAREMPVNADAVRHDNASRLRNDLVYCLGFVNIYGILKQSRCYNFLYVEKDFICLSMNGGLYFTRHGVFNQTEKGIKEKNNSFQMNGVFKNTLL